MHPFFVIDTKWKKIFLSFQEIEYHGFRVARRFSLVLVEYDWTDDNNFWNHWL